MSWTLNNNMVLIKMTRYNIGSVLLIMQLTKGCNAQRDDFVVPPENTYHIVTDTNPATILCTTPGDGGAATVRDSWYICEADNTCQAGDRLTEDGTIYDLTKYGLDREEAQGQYNLEINDVAFLDAGAYMCQATRDATDHKAIAKLLVIEKHPTCEHVAENPMADDDVTLHCRVTYSGDFYPVMVWTSDSDHAIPDAPPTESGSDTIHTYDYTFDISLTRKYKQITFTCQTTFKLATEPPNDKYDENDPDYDQTCETIINIKIPPENATTIITTEDDQTISDGDVLDADDKLVCDDKTANPPPSVTWTQDPGSPVLDGDKLVIQQGMLGHYYITCAGSNTIGVDTYTGYRAVNISVEAIPTTTTSTTGVSFTEKSTLRTTSLNYDSSCPVCDSCDSQGALVAVIVILVISLVVNIAAAIYFILAKLRSPSKMQDDHTKGSANANIPRVTYENTAVPRHHPRGSTTQAAPIIYDEIAEAEPKYAQLDEETREEQPYINTSSDGAPMYQSLQDNTNPEYIELAE